MMECVNFAEGLGAEAFGVEAFGAEALTCEGLTFKLYSLCFPAKRKLIPGYIA